MHEREPDSARRQNQTRALYPDRRRLGDSGIVDRTYAPQRLAYESGTAVFAFIQSGVSPYRPPGLGLPVPAWATGAGTAAALPIMPDSGAARTPSTSSPTALAGRWHRFAANTLALLALLLSLPALVGAGEGGRRPPLAEHRLAFLVALEGPWEGQARVTPIGPRPYDMRLKRSISCTMTACTRRCCTRSLTAVSPGRRRLVSFPASLSRCESSR